MAAVSHWQLFPPHAAVRIPDLGFSETEDCLHRAGRPAFAPDKGLQISCMDHPDMPADGFFLPKKKKSQRPTDKSSSGKSQSRFGRLISGVGSQDKASKTSSNKAPPTKQPPPPIKPPSISSFFPTGSAYNDSDLHSLPSRTDTTNRSWRSRSSQDSGNSGPGRKMSLLSSRRIQLPERAPEPHRPGKVVLFSSKETQQVEFLNTSPIESRRPELRKAIPPPLTSPRLETRKPVPPSLPSPRSDHHSFLSDGVPTSPGWNSKGRLRVDEAQSYEEPKPTYPNSSYPPISAAYPPQFPPPLAPASDPAMALFAAATANMTPDHPQWKHYRQHLQTLQAMQGMPPVPPIPAIHTRAQSNASLRHTSTSSSSNYSMSNADNSQQLQEDYDAVRAYQALTGVNKSTPDLPGVKINPRDVFPPGHPLARWRTNSSFSSQESGHSAHESFYEAPVQRIEPAVSRTLDVPIRPVSPLSVEPSPLPSHRSVSPLSAEPPLPALPLHATSQASSSTDTTPPPPSQPSRSSDMPRNFSTRSVSPLPPRQISPVRAVSPLPLPPDMDVRRPVSPILDQAESPVEGQAWLSRNVSKLTVDTTVSPRSTTFPNDISNPRHSIVSALSSYDDVSPLEPGEMSPLDESDLPDYATSQNESQAKRQWENERRAQELQRRWAATTGAK